MKLFVIILWFLGCVVCAYLAFFVMANRYQGTYNCNMVIGGVVKGTIVVKVDYAYLPRISFDRKRFPYFDIITYHNVKYDMTDTSGDIVGKICWVRAKNDSIESLYYMFDNDMVVWGGKYNDITFGPSGPNKLGFGDEYRTYIDLIKL